jgi:hypothetical protein
VVKQLIGKAAKLSLTGRAAWIAIGIVVAALSWAGWTQWRIGNLHEQLGNCQGGTSAVADTATNNAEALADCQARLEEEVSQRLLAEEAERQANERLELETELRRDLAERERAARREAYDAEDCANWARQPVCPAVADSLRRAARGAGSADHRDPEAGDSPDP